MTEGLADSRNDPTERHLRLYAANAAGGAGLILTGNAMVDRRHLERARNVVLDSETDRGGPEAWAERRRTRMRWSRSPIRVARQRASSSRIRSRPPADRRSRWPACSPGPGRFPASEIIEIRAQFRNRRPDRGGVGLRRRRGPRRPRLPAQQLPRPGQNLRDRRIRRRDRRPVEAPARNRRAAPADPARRCRCRRQARCAGRRPGTTSPGSVAGWAKPVST